MSPLANLDSFIVSHYFLQKNHGSKAEASATLSSSISIFIVNINSWRAGWKPWPAWHFYGLFLSQKMYTTHKTRWHMSIYKCSSKRQRKSVHMYTLYTTFSYEYISDNLWIIRIEWQVRSLLEYHAPAHWWRRASQTQRSEALASASLPLPWWCSDFLLQSSPSQSSDYAVTGMASSLSDYNKIITNNQHWFPVIWS